MPKHEPELYESEIRKIQGLAAQGLDLAQIAVKTHISKELVEKALNTQLPPAAGGLPDAGGGSGTGPDGSPAAGSGAGSGAAPVPPAVPPSVPPGPDFPPSRPANSPFGASSTTSPPVPAAKVISDLAGEYRISDIHATLYNIMIENGIEERQAKGFVRTFAYERPDNARELRRILAIAGIKGTTIESILNAWKSTLRWAGYGEEAEPEGGTPRDDDRPRETVQERLRKLREPTARESEAEVTKMEQEKTRIALERERIALERDRRENDVAKAALQPPPPPAPGEETIEITIDAGGFPKPLTIKASQLPMYESVKWKGRAAEEPPAWAKPLLEDYAARRNQPPQPSGPDARDAKIAELERQIHDQTITGLQNRIADQDKRMDQVLAQNARIMDPEFFVGQRARFDRTARAAGYQLTSEGDRVNEEEILLTERRKKGELNLQTQTEVLELIKGKIEKTGSGRKLLDKIAEGPAADKIIARLVKSFGETPAEQGEAIDRATAEEILGRVQQLEHIVAQQNAKHETGEETEPPVGVG